MIRKFEIFVDDNGFAAKFSIDTDNKGVTRFIKFMNFKKIFYIKDHLEDKKRLNDDYLCEIYDQKSNSRKKISFKSSNVYGVVDLIVKTPEISEIKRITNLRTNKTWELNLSRPVLDKLRKLRQEIDDEGLISNHLESEKE
tara:strand:- start:75 stop:497 length:423 start_codon:yes stop_codon:yes gene_type:complete